MTIGFQKPMGSACLYRSDIFCSNFQDIIFNCFLSAFTYALNGNENFIHLTPVTQNKNSSYVAITLSLHFHFMVTSPAYFIFSQIWEFLLSSLT